jgi:NHL repeat
VGDGCPATNASLSTPNAIAVDSTGILYIADNNNFRIRKVSAGVIATVAGNGTMGFSGDGGPATSAQIGYSVGVAVDSAGNLYLVDNYTRIRKVSSGVITTVAGNGTGGYSGDGVPATSASISPWGVAVDGAGSLYIADFSNNRVRKVSGGIITTVAGTGVSGFSGDGGPATSAQISYATSVAVDSTGNLYIGDAGNYRIRKVAGGIISTIAGNGLYSYSGDGGPATEAQLSYVSGLAADAAGNLYISDPGSGRVRVVSSGGTISTFAGGGTSAADGIPATSATLTPSALAAAGGDLYVRDTSSRVLRKVSSGIITTITTIAGQGSYPFPGGGGVAVDTAGHIYVSDVPDSRVRMLTPGSGGTVPISITSSPAGVSITVTGPGCDPGTYTTPAKLTWASRISCTVKFGDPQFIGGVNYAFRSSTVNGSATSHQNPRTINSGTSALKINATYSPPGGGQCDDGTGGDDGGKCGDGTGGDEGGQGGRDSDGGRGGEH